MECQLVSKEAENRMDDMLENINNNLSNMDIAVEGAYSHLVEDGKDRVGMGLLNIFGNMKDNIEELLRCTGVIPIE